MDISTYLPDELGERAKAAELKFSALLRAAVTAELKRLDRLAAASDGMVSQELEVIDEGEDVLLRFVGKHVYGNNPAVYLTEGGAVILVWEKDKEYSKFNDVERFVAWVRADELRYSVGRESEETMVQAVVLLGGRRVVELS